MGDSVDNYYELPVDVANVCPISAGVSIRTGLCRLPWIISAMAAWILINQVHVKRLSKEITLIGIQLPSRSTRLASRAVPTHMLGQTDGHRRITVDTARAGLMEHRPADDEVSRLRSPSFPRSLTFTRRLCDILPSSSVPSRLFHCLALSDAEREYQDYTNSMKWKDRFELLRLYYQTHGHTNVPRDYKTEKGLHFGRWVSEQRNRARFGKSGKPMGKARKKMLTDLDPTFLDDPVIKDWDMNMKRIEHYQLTHGDINAMPREYVDEDGFPLGNWLRNRRLLLSGKAKQRNGMPKGRSPTKKRAELEDMGVIINEEDFELWEVGYKHLAKYREQFGDCMVPKNFQTDDGYRLGLWVAENRKRYNPKSNRDRLIYAKVKLMDELGMVWDTGEEMEKSRRNFGGSSSSDNTIEWDRPAVEKEEIWD